MPAAAPTYQRLPGSGHRRVVPVWALALLFFAIGIFVFLLRGRRVQLWMGADHLLVLEWDGYRESYRRFRYEDIQLLTLHQTGEGALMTGIASGAALITLALGFAIWNPGGTTFFFILTAIFGGAALINLLRGPTCRCELRTAVQIEELVSLTRVRTAAKALEILRPRIVTAQGELAAEELYARTQEALFAAAADPDAPPVIATHHPATAPERPVTIQPYHGRTHAIFFWLLLIDLPVTIVHFLLPGVKLADVLGWGIFLVTVGFAIGALARQHHTDLPRPVKRITWGALINLAVSLVVGLMIGFYLLTNSNGAADPAAFRYSPGVIVAAILFTGTSVFLGGVGLMGLRRFRAAPNAAAAPLPPPPPPTL